MFHFRFTLIAGITPITGVTALVIRCQVHLQEVGFSGLSCFVPVYFKYEAFFFRAGIFINQHFGPIGRSVPVKVLPLCQTGRNMPLIV